MSPGGVRQPFKWIRPEVYPLFAAVALGCTASVVIMSHSLFGDPVVVINKNKRHEDPPEGKGPAHYNHMIRRMVHGAKMTILPDFFKQETDDSSPQDHHK